MNQAADDLRCHDEVVFGVVEYEICEDGSLNGTWTVPSYKGKLGREFATGGTPGQLEGPYDVNIYDYAGKNIYQGTLEISRVLDTYSLRWTSRGRPTYMGLGVKAGECRLAANYRSVPEGSSQP